MKKFLLIFVFLTLNMGLQAAVKIDGIWYDVGDWATVVRPPEGEVYSGTVDIPNIISYNGYIHHVRNIGELAFAGFSGLTIKMGADYKVIAPNAFNDCSDLTIEVPYLYTWIHISFVFEDGGKPTNDLPMQFVKSLVIGGEELTDLDLTGTSVTTLNYRSFSGYRGLRSVIIPETMKTNMNGAFSYCTGLTSVKVNDGVQSLGSGMFMGCTALTDVELPSSLKVIPDDLFSGCISLETIQLPENLTQIGSRAFDGCVKLTGILFPESLTTIGERAFRKCESIIDLQFPSSNLTINDAAFSGAKGIKELHIPSNVKLIGNTFANCLGLETVYLSGRYTGYNTFQGCTGLKTAYISSSYVQSGAFENCSSLNFVELEDGLIAIYSNAFDGCASLKTIKFPITLRVNYCSFKGCDELEYFDIKSIDAWNKMEIATELFKGRRHLRLNGWEVVKEVHVAEGITQLADYLYDYNEDITQVHLPSTLTQITGFKYCPNITGIYCYAEERVPYLNNYEFGQLRSLYETEEELNQYLASVTVHVRGHLLEAFKADPNWGKFGRIIAISGTDEKCTTPEITYENGKLTFQCDTPDAEIITTIKDSDMGTYSGNEIQLNATYIIRAYAIAKDYMQSDVNVATLCWIDANPKIETRIIDTEDVKAQPVLIQCFNGQLVISGVKEGQHIVLYSVSGEKLNETFASTDKVTFTSPCQGNKMILVQIDGKSIKVAGKF